jgi:endonuclease/exonuclease/phosphatase family metal-dependent hydrolase
VTVNVLTYNTHGLPPPVLPDRTVQFTAMSPLIEAIPGTAIVALQEVFGGAAPNNYYGILTAPIHAYESPFKVPTPPEMVGDGLTLLSDVPGVAGYTATQWSSCFGTNASDGGDCLAEKGFSFARITLGTGIDVDFYNLHADAGQDPSSQTARRANITQLITAINATSSGRAVIVVGDTNSLYTRDTDNIKDLLAAGFTDTWVWLVKGGIVPGAGPVNDSGCPPPVGSGNAASGPNCELKDKIFFRSGTTVQITAVDYDVLTSFVDNLGVPLSDHLPVLAQLDVTSVPEPATVLCLLGALAALGYARGSTRQ